MTEVYIAKVAEHIEAEDSVKVLLLGASAIEAKVRVLHKRANPLYGVSGDLPDIGETGIVLKADRYGEYFWVGSFHNPVENICTTEANKVINHHDSDIWSKIDKNGNAEFSHPSGTYLKIGSNTDLSQRTRYKRKADSYNLKESVNYDACQQQPVNIFLKHIWVLSALTEGGCINDNRKKAYSGATKSTTIQINDSGTLTITHETTGADITLTIDSDGNVTLSAPTAIKLLCDLVQAGQATGEKTLATEDIIAIFNAHVHAGVSTGTGSTSIPSSLLSSSQMTLNLKAT